MIRTLATCATLLLSSAVAAETPEIINVTAEKTGPTWQVAVTLRHPDTGWDHYADGWDVRDADGTRLGYRQLHHPHVDEQPFIRAHCSVDGWSDETRRVALQP